VRFVDVGAVLHQCSGLGCESRAAALALSGFGDRLSRGFGASEAAAVCDLVERAETVAAEPER
jgi:hypothetical protein